MYPYNVMTNSPGVESHIRRLNKYMDLDNLGDVNYDPTVYQLGFKDIEDENKR